MIIIFRNIYLYCITNTEHTESRTTNWNKSIELWAWGTWGTTTHACGYGIDGIFSVLELYYDDACHGRSPQTPIKCFSNNNHSRTHWDVVVKRRCRMECHIESTRKNSIGHSIKNCQQFRIEAQNYAKWKPRTHSHIWQKHRYVATDHWLLWPGCVYVCGRIAYLKTKYDSTQCTHTPLCSSDSLGVTTSVRPRRDHRFIQQWINSISATLQLGVHTHIRRVLSTMCDRILHLQTMTTMPTVVVVALVHTMFIPCSYIFVCVLCAKWKCGRSMTIVCWNRYEERLASFAWTSVWKMARNNTKNWIWNTAKSSETTHKIMCVEYTSGENICLLCLFRLLLLGAAAAGME